MRARSVTAVAIAALLLAVAAWSVVPAPTPLTFPLAVAVPELAPQLLAFAMPLGALVWWLARGRSRTAACVLALLAIAALAWPAIAAPFAGAGADRRLRAAGIGPAPVRPLLAVDVSRDLPVRLRDGGTLALDLYRPHVAHDVPLIVFIYGGAWSFGSRAGAASLDRWYAARGFAVAAIDYRHAPGRRFPVQRDDVDDALRTIASHARAWRLDPARVALFGRSAGAELALLAAERPQPLRVRAAIAYYAPVDLIDGWYDLPKPDPAGVRAILSAYLGGPPEGPRRALYVAASPLDGVHAHMPAVLMIAGSRDEEVRVQQQRAFAARAAALGVETIALELPWANHAFDEVDGLGSSIAHDATIRFLRAHLMPPGSDAL